MFLRLEIDLDKGVYKGTYGTGNSNILSVHKSIYRHIFLWLEIDLDKGVLTEYYGTLNRRKRDVSNDRSGREV